MARKIHRVRKRSRKERCLAVVMSCPSFTTEIGSKLSKTAPARWLRRADEGAPELPVHLGFDRAYVDPGVRQELPRFLNAVDPRRLDGDFDEYGRGELRRVLLLGERPGDAADPELEALLDRRRH